MGANSSLTSLTSFSSATNAPPLAEVIDNLGFGWGQGKALLVGGGVWLADGAELLIISSVTRAVSDEWGLNAWERGSIVSIVFIGIMLGNILSGQLGDALGRRIPIVVSYAGILVLSILSVCAWNFWSMVAIRCTVGMAIGIGQPAWNALGAEISPAAFRIHMMAMSQCFFTFGEFFSAALIWYDDPQMKQLDWRWLILMGTVPSVLFLVTSYLFLMESPSYLALHGRVDEAEKELMDLRLSNGHGDGSVSFKPVPPGAAQASTIDRMRIVLGPHLRFTTLVTCVSTVVMNFLFYGGLYAFPRVLPEIELAVSPAMNLMLGACMELPGYALGLAAGIYLTRKTSIMGYLAAVFVSTCVFGFAASAMLENKAHGRETSRWIEVLLQMGLSVNKLFTSVGFLIVYLYSIEVYPTGVRATGTSVCVSVGRLGSILCPLVYEWLIDLTGGHLTFFWLMAGMCVLNLGLVALLNKETHGAALQDDLAEVEPIAKA